MAHETTILFRSPKKEGMLLTNGTFFSLVFQNEKKKPSTKSGFYNPATLGLNIQHILMIEFYLPLSLPRRLFIALASMCLNISLVIRRWIFKIFAIIYMEIRYEEMKKKCVMHWFQSGNRYCLYFYFEMHVQSCYCNWSCISWLKWKSTVQWALFFHFHSINGLGIFCGGSIHIGIASNRSTRLFQTDESTTPFFI